MPDCRAFAGSLFDPFLRRVDRRDAILHRKTLTQTPGKPKRCVQIK